VSAIKEDRRLELSGEEFRRLVEKAAARIASHVDSLPDQPAAETKDGEALARALAEDLPETGESEDRLFDLLFERVIPASFNTAGPGYLAYIPGGGILDSAVADLIADSTNRYVGVFAAAPGLAQIEANVVSWFCSIAGYPRGSGGVLTSGGSSANLSALVTARREKLPENFLSGTIYVSDQTHHSIQKAAMLAGFPPGNVREIGSDGNFRIRIEELRTRIDADRRAGLTPFLVVGNAGTTNTGAVDDLGAVADVAKKENLWFHADAAYGGFFLLTDEGRRTMAGIERADSIVLDPHKGLFLPYGTGSLLVRDAGALKRAHALTAEYLPAMQEKESFVDFCQISPELSRDWRGLRVWLPVKRHGIAPFRVNLQEKLDLARLAAEELEKIPGIEIVARPQLSIVAFRLSRPGLDPEREDALNHEFLERINARQRVHLTGTRLRERFVLRICVLSFRTHLERLKLGLEDIRASAG
jgi:aromatic-L-amino-acid decarboxylase